MPLYDIIFYFIAAIVLGAAAMAVMSRNMIHAAYSLFFTLFGMAGLYVLLSADFIAVIQLLIYVGGILILLIFGVMLTTGMTTMPVKADIKVVIAATTAIGVIAAFLINAIMKAPFKEIPLHEKFTAVTLNQLGTTLINEYALVFELFGMLLLLALIGAASIARK